MAGFHDIIGHEKIKEHLQKAIGYQRVSHAYILSGEEGMGRKTIAKAFAMTLLCEKHGTEPCMECHSCKQFLSGNHPDVIWVTDGENGRFGWSGGYLCGVCERKFRKSDSSRLFGGVCTFVPRGADAA